jgi:hypothetical protein
MAPSTFQLPTIEFFSNPMSAEDAVIDRCIEAEFDGLIISAPSRVNIRTHDSLPLVGCWAASLRDAKRMPLDETVIATAVCVETGATYAALAVQPPEVAEPFEPSDRDPGEGTTYRMFLCDLHRRLDLPWKPGTFLITLLQQDRRSNRVLAELGQADTYDDPEVRRLFIERFNKQRPPQVQPEPAIQIEPREGQPRKIMLPTFERIPTSPAIPGSPGVALKVERVVVTEPEAQAVLAGSFSLPIMGHQILSLERELVFEGTSLKGTTGVIPMMIVISGSERPSPLILNLGVPTFDALQPGVAGTATGHFALDLLAIDVLRRMPSQTYFIHVLTGQILTDTTLTAFVDPRLLPDI